jgi:hypothetical protein
MCCLKYEHPLYQEFNAKAPATGTAVETPAGDGVVVGHNVPSDTVVVRLAASGRRCACSRADVCSPRQQYEASDTTTSDAPLALPDPQLREELAPKAEPAVQSAAPTAVEATTPEADDVRVDAPAETAGEGETSGKPRRKPRRRRRLSQAAEDSAEGVVQDEGTGDGS